MEQKWRHAMGRQARANPRSGTYIHQFQIIAPIYSKEIGRTEVFTKSIIHYRPWKFPRSWIKWSKNSEMLCLRRLASCEAYRRLSVTVLPLVARLACTPILHLTNFARFARQSFCPFFHCCELKSKLNFRLGSFASESSKVCQAKKVSASEASYLRSTVTDKHRQASQVARRRRHNILLFLLHVIHDLGNFQGR